MPVLAYKLHVEAEGLLEAVDDRELSPASQWAFEVSRDGAMVSMLADIPRAASALKSEWLLETKVNFALTQMLSGCIGVYSPDSVVVPLHGNTRPVLPQDVHAQITPQTPWVVKMDGTSGGHGITIVHSAAEAVRAIWMGLRSAAKLGTDVLGSGGSSSFHAVLQKYVSRPALIDGCKFGVRFYTLTHNGRTWIYDAGFVKLAAVAFDLSSTGKEVHVTSIDFTGGLRRGCTSREAGGGAFDTAEARAEVERVVGGLVAMGELNRRTKGVTDEFLVLAYVPTFLRTLCLLCVFRSDRDTSRAMGVGWLRAVVAAARRIRCGRSRIPARLIAAS